MAVSNGPGQSYWSFVWRQFKRNRIAVAGLYVVAVLFAVAIFADFLANDKPYYLRYQNKTYFPIFRSYLVQMGLVSWPPQLLNVDFKKLDSEISIFPPIPYRSNSIDLTIPFSNPSPAHWLGTDKLGRDLMAGIIHGSRISLSIGFVAVGISLIIGIVLGGAGGVFWLLGGPYHFEVVRAHARHPDFLLTDYDSGSAAAEYFSNHVCNWPNQLGGDCEIHTQRVFADKEFRLHNGGHSIRSLQP